VPADVAPIDARRTELRHDGATVWPGLLDAAWCARLRAAIERCRATPSRHYGVLSPPGTARVDSDLFRWSDDPDLAAVTHDSPLVVAACALLGSDGAVLIEDQWFASDAGATTASPWHQDEPYYRLDRPFLTIWVTLDDIDERCSLRVVPGSHASGELYGMVEFSAQGSTIDVASSGVPVPDVDADPERYAVRSWSMHAGDAIALDSRTLHATGRGALPRPFRRLSTRWADPATSYRTRGAGAAAFWELLPHGLADGDPIAGDVFPLVGRGNRPGASSQI
jgi:hypothetical protein